ncbi:MAG: GBS Bsp-like repeat-containing protein, partial [[Ruminococcus] gnavus]|nr:GBS Bsp-like repeat-containing protein [Mediterraneibacter gnavus]
MKKVQKVLALLLVFMMVFTTAGMNVAAAGEMDSVAGEADIQSQEQQQTLDETDTQQEATQQTSEGILEYVYVDESVVNMPQTQNIAVGFSDENLVLESAVLHYSSVVTGEQFEMPASAIVNNTVLFTQDYPEGSAEDVYQLDSLTYQSSGVSSTVNLLDEEIDAGYTVTVQPEEENSSEEAVPDVAVYSLSEDGNVIEASSDTENIEETVAGVLEEADPVSPLAREARANKTVVICAGHDATHTGASGNGLKEEELTFKVAQYCKQALEQYQGVTVYMDRDSISCKYPGQSTSYCLNQRIKDAAALGATVFVDIHFNTGGGTGAEVYYPNKSYNEGIHQDGQNLANKILSELSALGLTNRGAKIKDGTTGETDSNGNKDDYFTTNYLSKQYGMTGVIVEHAFLDSASDAAKLKDENFLKKLGEADAAGIAATYGFSKGDNGNEQATVQIKNKNDFNGTAQIEVSGVGAGAQIAVWSDDNGQDDLKWYSVSGNSGTVNFDIKNHKKSAGTYNVHVYNSSSTKILCNTTFRVSKDTSAKLKVSAVDGRQDLYRVKLSFADMPDEVSGVQFPVWSKGDQSDIRWITAQKTSSGVWEADVSISGYQIGDIYQVHAYASLTNGKQVFIGNSTFKVVGPSADVTIKNYSAENGTFDVVVENIVAPAGVKEV